MFTDNVTFTAKTIIYNFLIAFWSLHLDRPVCIDRLNKISLFAISWFISNGNFDCQTKTFLELCCFWLWYLHQLMNMFLPLWHIGISIISDKISNEWVGLPWNNAHMLKYGKGPGEFQQKFSGNIAIRVTKNLSFGQILFEFKSTCHIFIQY